MIICDKCGRTIANVQPVVHYSTCASCWQTKRENQQKEREELIMIASKKNDDTRT